MCCKTIFEGKTYRPGDVMPVTSPKKEGKGKWCGFARSETAEAVWGDSHNVSLDVPADSFGEHNRPASKAAGCRVETEVSLPPHVIYALGNRKTGAVKILTRDASETERANLGHDRVPVTGPQRFFPVSETEEDELSPGA